jgi:predicted DNA-binding protein (MmcQ/YjbR family)
MVNIQTARTVALSFEGAVEQPHFELTSFRVNKKIFATMDEKNKRICIKLTKTDQSVFSAYNSSVIYPVPNKWGLQGATYIELDKVPAAMFKDALAVAYCMVAPKSLPKNTFAPNKKRRP